jgi:hypothetical protein
MLTLTDIAAYAFVSGLPSTRTGVVHRSVPRNHADRQCGVGVVGQCGEGRAIFLVDAVACFMTAAGASLVHTPPNPDLLEDLPTRNETTGSRVDAHQYCTPHHDRRSVHGQDP